MTARKASIPRKTAAHQHVSLETTAQKDDTSATLAALRDGIARQLDECTSKRDYAALSRQLQQVLAQIDSHRKSPRSIRNELAAKRAERQRLARRGTLKPPAPAAEPTQEADSDG
jgi:uncharacterized coiled-coil DUF342 family protein